MSNDAVKANATQRKQEHEAKLQRQILDWIEVKKPQRGNVLVMRVPDEKFAPPGTPLEDIPAETKDLMAFCHSVLRALLSDLGRAGVLMGGAAVLSESMSIEDIPPPPPEVREQIAVAQSRIVLPPGTKI